MTRKAGRPKRTGAPETKHVTGEPALRALASPLRMEILQAFSRDPRLTVRELAGRLGIPRGSLYYHVRKLAQIGVLVEVDRNRTGRRYESVYEMAADRISVAADASTETGRDATLKLVLSTLRQTGREFEAALRSGLFDEHQGLQIGQRQRVWLTDEDLAKLQSLLSRIEKICARANAPEKGRPYAVTSLVVPLAMEDPEPGS